MKALGAPLLIIALLAGCGGDSAGSRSAEAESEAREVLAHCERDDVKDVECRPKANGWSCKHSARDRAGVIWFEDGDHPETSVTC